MNELIRFFGITLLGVVIDIAIAWALHTYAGVPLWIAATCGFVLTALGNYIGHQKWTFQTGSNSLSVKRGIKYGAVALITLGVRVLSVAILERVWEGGVALLILIGAAGASFVVNFTLSKLFVFAEPAPERTAS
ncbi:MAG: GtrA family protein [Pseudomonadota bacterium]